MTFLEQYMNMSPQSIMLQASLGPILSKAIYVITKLNIADFLTSGSKNAEELAEITGTNTHYLYRIMRFLSGFGIFLEDNQGFFSLTSLSSTLRTDAPDSPRDWILFNAEPWRWGLVQAMNDVIKTGKSSYENIYGKNAYGVFAEKPEFGLTFNKAMKSWSSSLPAAVINNYDFCSAKLVVDVGGGMGDLLTLILKTYPTLKGILFDQNHVVKEVEKATNYYEIADRCLLAGGNFLTSVPVGGDLYIISSVLMDWSNEDCITILQNCYNVMAPNGKVLIIEPMIGALNEQTFGKSLDMIMLLETAGRIRDKEEWEILLNAADFRIKSIIPTNALSMYIIEAGKVGGVHPALDGANISTKIFT
ncbi:O-methyltransferase family protein [Calothrix sp. NIES-4071]|nr:O-methyltransferase family protein [Calothrix sp. NIES-4071]BAZ56648.1 O-methyltransferase family protein [Calothrix sp. NIES-4105]